MKRRIFKNAMLIALALLLPLAGLAEGLTDELDEVPGEVGEYVLPAPEPTADASPMPTAAQTPLPTLEPGSINYSRDKINFESEIWAILTRNWGLADFQAAGLMSSIYAESSFCPYNAQGFSGIDNRDKYEFKARDSVGFGLCQWTDASRKSGLYRYAAAHGDANLVWDFDIQMGYMKREIDMNALKNTESLYEATEWAVLWYERPNQAYENSWPGSRYAIARQIFAAHTGKPYEEPELAFALLDADGKSVGDGFALAGDARLTIRSNYYWRLKCDKPWLNIQRGQLYEPEAWETCQCGYFGDTELRLRALVPPISRKARLRLSVYCDGGVVQTVSVTYTGQTLPEALIEWAPPMTAVVRAAWKRLIDGSLTGGTQMPM